MLTQASRKEIKELIESGLPPTIKWLASIEDQLSEAPIESYSGELIDKRPEEKKRAIDPFADQIGLDAPMEWGDPVVEIEFGSGQLSLSKRIRNWIKKHILRSKEKTGEEQLKELLDEFSPFGEMHDEAERSIAPAPKNLLPELSVLRQAVAYAELMFPVTNDWNAARNKAAELRKILSKSLGPNRHATIQNSAGSRVALEVEESKEVEIPPEVISRHVLAARQR